MKKEEPHFQNPAQEEHPKAETDVFLKKRTQHFGMAERSIHFSGQDSIFYSDAWLVDCNLEAGIYCYINFGSEWSPDHSVSAYRGLQTEYYLWYFQNDKPIYDIAIDKRCKYAAIATEEGIYIVEANPKRNRYYPENGDVIRPEEWGVLRGFSNEKNAELAFDDKDLLHVREYECGLRLEDKGGDIIRYILDIDSRQAFDEDGVINGALEDMGQLRELALNGHSPELRFLAMQNLDGDEEALHIFETDEDERLRRAAVNCMEAQTALADIAVNAPKAETRKAAVSRLTDMALLEKIYFETEHVKDVRYAAWFRLQALKGRK